MKKLVLLNTSNYIADIDLEEELSEYNALIIDEDNKEHQEYLKRLTKQEEKSPFEEFSWWDIRDEYFDQVKEDIDLYDISTCLDVLAKSKLTQKEIIERIRNRR